MKYLIFDTETTGVVPKGMTFKDKKYPRLLQLAWLLIDEAGTILDSRSNHIIPVGFEIPKTEFHIKNNLTYEICSKGEPLHQELDKLLEAIESCDMVVAHNMSFDYYIIASEIYKLNIDKKISKKPKICTMRSTTEFVGIKNQYGFKFPKLEELHMKLFGKSFDGAHDALADVKATYRCLMQLKVLNIKLVEI